MNVILTTFLILVVVTQRTYSQAHHLKFHKSAEDNSCKIIEDENFPTYRGMASADENEMKYSIKPAIKNNQDNIKTATLDTLFNDKSVDVFANKREVAHAFMASMCKSVEKLEPTKSSRDYSLLSKPEVRKIVDNGDQANRIDIVFMGDGYLASEKMQFFQDMERLTKDMFEGITFRSYLPLFNIWAIFVPSQESGIGWGEPKNTSFGLYRWKSTLRMIIPTKVDFAREICNLTGPLGCDYPSVIANDDFYGGLGGDLVISTRGERTGTIVLRHEMGHNFIDAGDEYDVSPTYFGVNSSPTVEDLGWAHWLSGEKKEERVMYRLLEYPWTKLDVGEELVFPFESDGSYHRWVLLVSVSSAGEEDSMEFVLDGKRLPWKTNGFDDREFYYWRGDAGLTAGNHTFIVRAKTSGTHPLVPRMVCNIQFHEYGNEEEFHMDNNYISAYPTFGEDGKKTYRPTNEGCLMRNITEQHFCSICKEGMWTQFLSRVSLIDNVTVSYEKDINGMKDVILETLKLGQFRKAGNEMDGETLDVKWTKNGEEQRELTDQFNIKAGSGNWTVEVYFNTPEVRKDPLNLLTAKQSFVI